ncbi:hypothetical protein DFH09DRAFT_1279599 [Mycena vulgaris]|nr:hypothetical protein DFH09DRAFT_1279599 [Mycena vulgaris]
MHRLPWRGGLPGPRDRTPHARSAHRHRHEQMTWHHPRAPHGEGHRPPPHIRPRPRPRTRQPHEQTNALRPHIPTHPRTRAHHQKKPRRSRADADDERIEVEKRKAQRQRKGTKARDKEEPGMRECEKARMRIRHRFSHSCIFVPTPGCTTIPARLYASIAARRVPHAQHALRSARPRTTLDAQTRIPRRAQERPPRYPPRTRAHTDTQQARVQREGAKRKERRETGGRVRETGRKARGTDGRRQGDDAHNTKHVQRRICDLHNRRRRGEKRAEGKGVRMRKEGSRMRRTPAPPQTVPPPPPLLLARAGAIGACGKECMHEAREGGAERRPPARLQSVASESPRTASRAGERRSYATREACVWEETEGGDAQGLRCRWEGDREEVGGGSGGYGRLWLRVLPNSAAQGSEGTGARVGSGGALCFDGVDAVRARDNSDGILRA